MFLIKKRVIFADTDAGGIVYHSKYLDFCEEARMEFFIQNGLTQKELMDKYNIIFVATSCEVKYKKPAQIEDLLDIRINKIDIDKLTIKFYENIYKNDILMASCVIDIVTLTKDFKIVRKIPEEILSIFKKGLKNI